MKVTYDRNYGSDIDGNRGITVIDECLLTDDDYYIVREEIERIYCGEDYDEELFITLEDDGVECEFDVFISDYFTEDEIEAMKKEFS